MRLGKQELFTRSTRTMAGYRARDGYRTTAGHSTGGSNTCSAYVGVSFNALASISSQMVITSRRSISEVRRNGEERARDGESKGRTGREASSQRGEEKEGSRGATERDRARDSNRGRESGRVQEGRHSKAFASAALCRIPSLFTVSMLETISRA